jgi:Xaa-Pro aminopeptidase
MILEQVAQVTREAGADGWLLYDFRGLNPLASDVLRLKKAMLSRRWFVFVPVQGRATLIHHRIEASNWNALLRSEDLERRAYSSFDELDALLAEVLQGSRRVLMEYSPRGSVPYVGRVDAGTIERVREHGVEVLSSADALQHFTVWSDADLEMHRRAVAGCIAAKDAGFALIHERLRAKESITELEVQARVEQVITEHGLTNDHPAIVGFAGHAGDPHYAPSPETNRTLEHGTCVLIDLWGGVPGHPMADITWMGYAGDPSAEFLEVWRTVAAARDAAIAVLKPGLEGWMADKAGRDVIEAAGYGAAFTHRVGHSLGTGITHGNGANLDNLETHDTRKLLPRTAVTVEPGVYLPHLGVRSEVNVLVLEDSIEVTTPTQQEPYTLGLEVMRGS